MKTIKILQQGLRWSVYFVEEKQIFESPMPASMPAAAVLEKIRRLNPGYYVCEMDE
ncbi:MAG: hypothetical protein ABIG61_07220 [Planctomycetota bacterium]